MLAAYAHMKRRVMIPVAFSILSFANLAMLLRYVTRGSATDAEAILHLVLSVLLLASAIMFLLDTMKTNEKIGD